MPYNEDGFYVENAPSHGKDAERRAYGEQQDLSGRIARLDGMLARWRGRATRRGLDVLRNGLVLELHELRLCHAAYDRRHAEAMRDGTGQDLDRFYDE